MSESPGFKLFGKTIVSSDQKVDNIMINQEDDHVLLEESSSMSTSTSTSTSTTTTTTSKRAQQHLSCPRCKSKETKFCYYNNYNVNQPRHFCKACHRYWTAGGLLRNVPVGAGRRKNRALLLPPTPPPSASTQEPAGSGGAADHHEEEEEEEGCASVVGRDWRGGSSGHNTAKSTFGNVDNYLIS